MNGAKTVEMTVVTTGLTTGVIRVARNPVMAAIATIAVPVDSRVTKRNRTTSLDVLDCAVTDAFGVEAFFLEHSERYGFDVHCAHLAVARVECAALFTRLGLGVPLELRPDQRPARKYDPRHRGGKLIAGVVVENQAVAKFVGSSCGMTDVIMF